MSSLISNHCPLTVAWSSNPAATGGHATTFIPPRTKSTPAYILHQRERRRQNDAAEEAGLLRAAAAAAAAAAASSSSTSTSNTQRASGAHANYGTASAPAPNSIYLNFIHEYEGASIVNDNIADNIAKDSHGEDVDDEDDHCLTELLIERDELVEEREQFSFSSSLPASKKTIDIHDLPPDLDFENSIERSRFKFAHLHNKSLPELPSQSSRISTHRLSTPPAPKPVDDEMSPMSTTLRYYDLPEREGLLWYRGHSDTKWQKVWCVVREKTVWVYPSRQDILPLDQISLDPGISVLPMESSAVDKFTAESFVPSAPAFAPPPCRTSHAFTVTTTLRAARTRAHQRHNHFAADSRLDMLLWMAQIIRTSQGAAHVPRTLVPIVSPAPSPPAVPRRATVGSAGSITGKPGRGGRGRKEAMVISAPLRALVRPAVNTSVRGANTWPGQSSSSSSSTSSPSSSGSSSSWAPSSPSSPRRLTLGNITRKLKELRGEA
ncbi:hypothetical protein HDU86_005138 [Geranomyces michiganensis]|nr:hypothetical protein HDU86_005138 [Geranomyces michiganensis]